MQTLLTKFPRLVTSDHHNFAMITNAKNSRPNGHRTGCLVSTVNVRINSESFPWNVRCAQERDLTNFRQRLLSYIATVLVWPRPLDMALVQPSERYIEEKQTELEIESK